MNIFQWLGLVPLAHPLAVGDAAPDVASQDQDGRPVRLADLYGDGYALVYFYPKADTPACTAQACSLRDAFAELHERGVNVIGVSSDGPAAQQAFRQKHRLPFLLLADADHAVARAFGVRLIFGLTFRQSFLIRNRRVVWRDLNASTRDQARDVLAVLEKA